MTIYENIKQLESVGQLHSNTLVNADCLEAMKYIADKSIDMVLCDLPYGLLGTTACKWDSIVPLDKLWIEYNRIIKDNGAIALTSLQPFSNSLINSNPTMFKYAYVWVKSRALGFQNAKLRPMTRHEDILIFSKGNSANRASNLITYNPQGLVLVNKKVNGVKASKNDKIGHGMERPSHKADRVQEYSGYPDTVLNFSNEGNTVHPTQKPVALLEYLIKTYTNDGETVLDNTFGSCSTGIACLNTNRKFIGIEMDNNYFSIGVERIKKTRKSIR